LTDRIVEAYVGEYASGKSENAIHRALELRGQGMPVSLIDLDLVEPFYTLRPLKLALEARGIQVVAWETKDTIGLGEAGSIILPQMRWALKREGHVILDVGYGVEGAKILNLLFGIEEEKNLQVIIVINARRPMTNSIEKIISYIHEINRADAILNNTHLGDETTLEVIQQGIDTVHQAADKLGLNVIGTVADEKWKKDLGEVDSQGSPMRYLSRQMQKAFW